MAYRYWVFTCYDFDLERPGDRWTELPDCVTYIVWQHERVTRDHLQGYLELGRKQRLSWLKRNISQTAHFERRGGTQAQAITYSKKEESRVSGPYELGEPAESNQGVRTDLRNFVADIRGGKRLRTLVDTQPHTVARFERFYYTVSSLSRPRREEALTVTLFYGDTGTGKTRTVYDMWGDDDEFFRLAPTTNNLWFDGYDMHENVLIDDFAGKQSKITLCMLLQVLDRYPLQLQKKGAYVWWMPKNIIITTNIHPHEWYGWEGRANQYDALERRFEHVFNFNEKDADGNPAEMDHDFWALYEAYQF